MRASGAGAKRASQPLAPRSQVLTLVLSASYSACSAPPRPVRQFPIATRSRRIDEARLGQNFVANATPECALGDQVDFAAQQPGQLSFGGKVAQEGGSRVGQNSTSMSMSLSGRISPRAAEPKSDSSFTSYRRQKSASSFSGRTTPGAIVIVNSTLHYRCDSPTSW